MKYDLECVLRDIKSLFIAQFDAQLLAVSADKNDGIVLASVDPAAYFLQTLNGPMPNYDPFIVYGCDDIKSTADGPYTAKEYSLSVVIVLADTTQDVEIANRLFRYQRAMEETMQKGWINPSGVKLEMKSLVPVNLSNLNNSQMYRAIGIQITANLGS